MLNRIKAKHSIDKLKNNSKIKVYKVFQGRRAFELGRDMIFVNPEECMSGDSENYNAVGEIYDKKKAIKRWKDFITFY
jgi:hypothetical protein